MIDDTIAGMRVKIAWALIGVTVVGFYDLGNKLKNHEKLTARGMLGDFMLQIVNAFVAVKLATLAGLGPENTAWLVLGVAFLGQKTALQIVRSVVLKYLGVTADDVAKSGIQPPSDPVSPSPTVDHLIDPRAVPIAQLGARYGSEASQRSAAHDPDRDLIDKLENKP